jgi:thymidylate synthase (FAD)
MRCWRHRCKSPQVNNKEASLSAIDAQALFDELNGSEEAGFAAIHSPACSSPGKIPYLRAPGVVVLARPHIHAAGLQGFLAGFDPELHFGAYLDDPTHLPDGAQLCKIAGQLCYMSFGPKRSMNAQAKRYFDNLKSSGHGSVFEHANFSLLLYGISRSVTHELIRHRAGFGFSQLSQRFVSGRMLRFVERPEYQADEQLHEQFLQRIERSAAEYALLANRLLEMQQAGVSILSAEARTDLRKKVQQSARSVLPNETEAPIVVTGNARAWRHVIEERASAHAEVEIRELAVRIFLCLRLADPVLFDDYTVERLPDGTYIVKTEFMKV